MMLLQTRRSQHSQECKHARTDFCASWPWSFDPKINGFAGLMVYYFYMKFGDPSCSGFWDIVQK